MKDIRQEPDDTRWYSFLRGWNDAAIRNKIYTEKTLSDRLTWQNLGNRLGQYLGDVPDDFKQQCFNYAVQQYSV
jgi:hypothetical protein